MKVLSQVYKNCASKDTSKMTAVELASFYAEYYGRGAIRRIIPDICESRIPETTGYAAIRILQAVEMVAGDIT